MRGLFTKGEGLSNPFCFPCCGYYCEEGMDCPCPDCKEYWKDVPRDDE